MTPDQMAELAAHKQEPMTDAQIKEIVLEASRCAWLRRDGTTSERIGQAVRNQAYPIGEKQETATGCPI